MCEVRAMEIFAYLLMDCVSILGCGNCGNGSSLAVRCIKRRRNTFESRKASARHRQNTYGRQHCNRHCHCAFGDIANEPVLLLRWLISLAQLRPDMSLVMDVSILSKVHFIFVFLFLLSLAFTKEIYYLLKPHLYLKKIF